MRVKNSDSSATWLVPKAAPQSELASAPASVAAVASQAQAPKWSPTPSLGVKRLVDAGPVVSAAAAMTAQHFLALRGDAARTLAGASLTNEVGAAMQLAPNHEPATPAQTEQLNDGSWPFYSGSPALAVKTVTDSISALAGQQPVHLACLPLTFSDPKSQKTLTLPLFRVDNADGTTRGFVDTSGRQYSTFSAWKAENTLPPGEVTYPANGHLVSKGDGQPMLVSEATVSTIDTTREHVIDWVEKAGLVGGFVVGAAALIGVGGVVVPLAGAALALGFGGKAVAGLVDAARHHESLNPLTSASARGNWLTAGASLVGLGAGAAATVAVRELASAGQVASVVGRAAPALGVSAEALGATQTVVGAVDLAHDWSAMSVKDRMLATSQLVFFGALTAKSASQAGGLQNLYSLAQTKARLEAAARPVVQRQVTAKEEAAAEAPLSPEQRLGRLTTLTGLAATDRAQLDAMVSGTNARSRRARAALVALTQTSAFNDATPAVQLAQVRQAFKASAPELVAEDVSSKLRTTVLKSTTRSKPVQLKAFNWEVRGLSRAPATRVDLTVRGHTVPVYSPVDGKFANSAGKQLVSHSHQDLIDALSMMPLEALERVKDIRLSPVPNPMDAHWAKLYNNPEMTSYMTCGKDGAVTVFPWKRTAASSPKDLATNMMHEIGHQWSMSAWGENFSRGRSAAWTKWAQAMKDDGLSPSTYGDNDVAEDVAESSALRASLLSHPELLDEYRRLFPHRFAILDDFFSTDAQRPRPRPR